MLNAIKKKEREDRFYANHPDYYRKQYQKRKDDVKRKYISGVYKTRKIYLDNNRERISNYVKTISDVYCRKRLRENGFCKEDITPELIELKRQHIKLKRLINEKL